MTKSRHETCFCEDDHEWQRSTSRHHGDRRGFPVPVPAVSTEVRELQSGSPSIISISQPSNCMLLLTCTPMCGVQIPSRLSVKGDEPERPLICVARCLKDFDHGESCSTSAATRPSLIRPPVAVYRSADCMSARRFRRAISGPCGERTTIGSSMLGLSGCSDTNPSLSL